MRFLKNIFGKSDKIKVEFINNLNNEVIGISEMSADQLPETFEVDTTMNLGDDNWSVIEAIPEKSSDFIKSKHLILKMSKIELMNPKDILFTLPTISNEIGSTIPNPLFNDFEHQILEDDWRQNEFLNKSSINLINQEIEEIKKVWKNDKKEDASFNAFKNCHVRSTIGNPNLKINFDDLKSLLKTKTIGSLKFIQNKDFVENAFVIKTEKTTFYGAVENDIITQLCISEFSDNTIEDIRKITNKFDLLFVGWYNYEIIGND